MLERSRGRGGGIPPNWASNVLLVNHIILQRVLDVGWAQDFASDTAVIASFHRVANSERSVIWRLLLPLWLHRELALDSVSLSERFEGSVLLDASGVGLGFVENEGGSSLVIKFSHILFSFVWVLDIGNLLLEGLGSSPGQKADRGISLAPFSLLMLLHVNELRVSHNLMAAGWLESRVTANDRLVALPEEVLARVNILVSDGVALKLFKRFRGDILASLHREVPHSADFFSSSALGLIISTGIANSETQRMGEEAESLPTFGSGSHFSCEVGTVSILLVNEFLNLTARHYNY